MVVVCEVGILWVVMGVYRTNRVVFEEALSTTQIKDLVNVPVLAVHFY